ncbi:MAG: GNAT family N-acetyltransferase [Planctomycetes bacterium]|nr:GNAT family N-acetyltransferase [Planctomycetota bacterium]
MPNIVLLLERPDLIPVLAAWFESEWSPYYGPSGPGDATGDLHRAAGRDLPVCLVAVTECGDPVGTITLSKTSIPHWAPGPWATALFVAPAVRGQGIGATLIAAIEAEARTRGYERLFLATDCAQRIVESRGWVALDEAETLRGRATVFELRLTS